MATYLYAVVPSPPPPAPAGPRKIGTRKNPANGRGTATQQRKRRPTAAEPAAPDAAAVLAQSLGTGVGQPPRPVEAIVHRDLAALVSTVGAGEVGGDDVRALRRDMKAHSAVLNRLLEQGTPSVLPVRFGVMFPSPRTLVETFLEPRHPLLCSYLERLRGAAEVSLKVTYLEDRVLREVVAERPDLARAAGAGSYQARIDLGQRVAGALRDKQDRDARWLLDALRPVVRDARTNQPASDLMVLNASFLVEKDGLPKFDQALERLNQQVGDLMRFDCVGPLPPYSFADLRL